MLNEKMKAFLIPEEVMSSLLSLSMLVLQHPGLGLSIPEIAGGVPFLFRCPQNSVTSSFPCRETVPLLETLGAPLSLCGFARFGSKVRYDHQGRLWLNQANKRADLQSF